MAEIIWMLLALALVFTVIKAAVILLVLGGLIFRTRETVGLLLRFGLLGLFETHPPIAIGIVAFILLCFVISARARRKAAPDVPKLAAPPDE